MITDRTLLDVQTAKTLRDTKIQQGIALTDTEKEKFERGSCTINTVNRIINKISELCQELNDMCYMCHITDTDDYTSTDIFYYNDITTLLENLNNLRSAFYVYITTPDTPTYLFGYLEANAIEQILVDIENTISDMQSKYRECGTFQCGERNTL